MTFLPFSSHVSSYSLPPGVSVASNDAYVSGTSSTGLEPCITSDTSRKVTVNYSSYSITANAPVIAFATTGGPTSSSGSVTITLAENSASYPYGFFKGIVNVPESDGSYIIPVSLISGSSVTISGDYLKSTGTQRGIIIPLRIRKCTITYNANGGSVSPSSESVRYGSSVTLPTPTRDHYAFNGWYTAATGGSYVGQGGDTYTPGSSITLYAHWTAFREISFDANGGTGAPSSVYAAPGGSWTCPSGMPTKANSIFAGWATSSSATYEQVAYFPGVSYSSPSANLTLYAVWVQEQGVIVYNPEGGTMSDAYKLVDVGSSYGMLPTPTKSGYSFDGWYTAPTGGTLVTSSTIMQSEGNVVIYAHWSLPTSYSYVYFNANGGSPTPSPIRVAQGQAIGTLPTVTRAGYGFLAWKDSASGSTITSSTVVGSANIYAIAEWARGSYIITLDPNGGTVSTNTMTVYAGEPYGRLPVPRRNGYNFLGWFTQDETQVLPSDIPSSSITLTAHWDDGRVVWFRADKAVADEQAL